MHTCKDGWMDEPMDRWWVDRLIKGWRMERWLNDGLINIWMDIWTDV